MPLFIFTAAYVAKVPGIAVTCTKDMTGNNIELAAMEDFTMRMSPWGNSVTSIILLILILKLNTKS